MTKRDAFLKAYITNVISTDSLTETFVPLLLRSASPRILFISSAVASLNLHTEESTPVNASPPSGWPKEYTFNSTTYRTSKTAMNMMALEWNRVLKNDGVKVFIVDPGFLATSLGGADPGVYKSFGAEEPIVGGMLVRNVIEGERDGDEGRMVAKGGVTPW